jgi:hypothetical protein
VPLAHARRVAREAPAAPQRRAPAILLTAPVLDALKKKARDDGSVTARIDRLVPGRPSPSPDCPTAIRATPGRTRRRRARSPISSRATSRSRRRACRFWRALLEDVAEMGDGSRAWWREPRGGARVRAARHGLRHPPRRAARRARVRLAARRAGVDEALRKQSRACFAAWIDFYTKDGYLHTQPGSNYHAGYVFAKTFVTLALAGEAGPTGERYWREMVQRRLRRADRRTTGCGRSGP